MGSHDKGNTVRVSAAFTTVATGAALDPTAVYCEYRDPSGNVTALVYGMDDALIKDSVGNYHVDIDADESGKWYYRFFSTGTGKAAGKGSFTVNPPDF